MAWLPERKKILVVDDEEEILVPLYNILKRANYEVTPASNGKEALEALKDFKPDLIILDVVMPQMDGGELANILSDDQKTAKIPILFLTGILTKEEEISGKNNSQQRYFMSKPADKDELLKTIQKILTQKTPPPPKPGS